MTAHTPEFFQGNRQRLASTLQGGLIVVTAYNEMQRRADWPFRFEQEASFWYLSGIDAPRWRLVYDGQRNHTWLIRPSIDEVTRVFDGEADSEELLQLSGADEVVDEADFEQLLRQLTRTHSTVHTIAPLPNDRYTFTNNPAARQLTRILERVFSAVSDCTIDIVRLRALKQPNEIKALERAVSLTVDGFEAIRTGLDTCRYEYEIEAIATGMFRHRGAQHAYDPIVAAGSNACTMHYLANTARLHKKQLVLCDIGAAVDGYVADITRTYAYGNATVRQQTVLAVLADAHSAIIRLVKPGVSFETYQGEVDRIMAGALRSLGLTHDSDQQLVDRYMPHAISHGLGIDVHDRLGGYKEFQPGMVLTVEPGIYIPSESIGTRIEDDILVTDTGHRNLSARLASNPGANLLS